MQSDPAKIGFSPEPCSSLVARVHLAEVSMGRIRIRYPEGYLRSFRIRIGFGHSFLRKIGSEQDQDICLISITKFP